MRNIISLMYHDVYKNHPTESGFRTPGALSYKLSLSNFEKHITAIHNYCERKRLDKDKIILTFDDGGISSIEFIAPLLEKYSYKGYFFITTSFIGTEGFINKQQIRDLQERGHYIGAHSHTHPKSLAQLTELEIEKEWQISINILNEILGSNVLYASIPGGSFSKESANILSKYGIKIIFTSDPKSPKKASESDCQIMGRFAIKDKLTYKDVISILKPISLSRAMLYLKWLVLRQFKKILGKKYHKIRMELAKANNM